MATGTIQRNLVLLWSGSLVETGSVQLSESFKNFPFLMVCWDVVGVFGKIAIFPTSGNSFTDGSYNSGSSSSTYYASFEVTIQSDNTTFTVTSSRKSPSNWGNSNKITAIYGLRL